MLAIWKNTLASPGIERMIGNLWEIQNCKRQTIGDILKPEWISTGCKQITVVLVTCCGNLIHSYQEEFKPYTNGTISTQTIVSHEQNRFTSGQDTPVLPAENWVQENVHRISDTPRGVKTSWNHSMISCSNRQRVWMRFTWQQLTSLRSSIEIVCSPYLPYSAAHTRIGSTIGYA